MPTMNMEKKKKPWSLQGPKAKRELKAEWQVISEASENT